MGWYDQLEFSGNCLIQSPLMVKSEQRIKLAPQERWGVFYYAGIIFSEPFFEGVESRKEFDARDLGECHGNFEELARDRSSRHLWQT